MSEDSRGARIEVTVETGAKKTFASALDWPGWSRSGKTEEAALAALADYVGRYAAVVEQAGEAGTFEPREYDVVEHSAGGSGTDFGVPSAITDLDHRPLDAAAADREARLVEAAWAVLDRVGASAPAELRKGPRGGGRDRDKMLAHVIEADWYYAREMGIRVPQPAGTDRAAIGTMRAAMLDALREPSDGSALAGRRWTPRYAARRIAWHSLDHAWEMEDRSDPG
jgi:hypothetical protein